MPYTMVSVTLSNISNNDMNPSKEQDHKQGYIVALIIFLTILFIVWKGPTLQYNCMRLYFPDKKKGELKLEKRPIAPIGTLEEKAQATIEELLLGPLSRDLKPLTHLDIKLLRIVEGKNALFWISQHKMWQDYLQSIRHSRARWKRVLKRRYRGLFISIYL